METDPRLFQFAMVGGFIGGAIALAAAFALPGLHHYGSVAAGVGAGIGAGIGASIAAALQRR
jgi:hypothetical protein